MQRIRSLDLARGFTVLFIPAIHTVMLYSKPEVYDTCLVRFLAFIAEGPGGQLFMALMGVVFTFKPKHSTRNILVKSVVLLGAGYLLNILKFIVPDAIGGLPAGIYRDLQLASGSESTRQLLMLGDILHFAAIALLLIHVIYRLKQYHLIAIITGALIVVLSPIVWDSSHPNVFLNYLLQLAAGQPPRVYFPVFPWLLYPLAGLAMGYGMRHMPDRIFPLLKNIGIACLISGYPVHLLIGDKFVTSFYRTWPWDTVWHLGIVLLTLGFWQWTSEKYKPNPFFQLLTYCSWHITSIYIIQWILICWLLPLAGYQALDISNTLVAILVTTSLTFICSYAINRFRQRFAK